MKQSTKIAKPSKDFPLTPHPSGRWCKKVCGVLHYFGRIDNPQAALDEWLRVKDYLLAGRTPPTDTDGLTVMDLCNHFMTSRQRKLDAGELTQKTWTDYDSCCRRLQAVFGKARLVSDLAPRDFAQLRAELVRVRSPVSLANEIQRARTVFKYGYDAGLLDKPIRYGTEFAKPPQRAIRLARAAQPARMFTALECRRLLKAASPKLRAMIYLALNAGYGNSYRVSKGGLGKLNSKILQAIFASDTGEPTSRKRRRPRQPVGEVMTVRQVAEVLAVDTATVTSWIRSGQLKASNVGNASSPVHAAASAELVNPRAASSTPAQGFDGHDDIVSISRYIASLVHGAHVGGMYQGPSHAVAVHHQGNADIAREVDLGDRRLPAYLQCGCLLYAMD